MEVVMHSDLEDLLKILIPITLKARSDQHSHANIEENDSKTKLNKITISHIPSDTLVFQIDKHKGKLALMSSLFQPTDFGHNKTCDALVVQRKDSSWVCLFIDLKSNKPSGFSAQFKSTRCFWFYLKKLLESFGSCPDLPVTEHYLVINTGKSSKRPTTPKTKNKPEYPHFLKVNDNTSIPYSSLFL